MTTEAGKYVIAKAVWNEGMRGHFIRMFSLTGPQDVEIMVRKIEEEAAAAERERIAAVVRKKSDEPPYDWDTTSSAEQAVSFEKFMAWLEADQPRRGRVVERDQVDG